MPKPGNATDAPRRPIRIRCARLFLRPTCLLRSPRREARSLARRRQRRRAASGAATSFAAERFLDAFEEAAILGLLAAGAREFFQQVFLLAAELFRHADENVDDEIAAGAALHPGETASADAKRRAVL